MMLTTALVYTILQALLSGVVLASKHHHDSPFHSPELALEKDLEDLRSRVLVHRELYGISLKCKDTCHTHHSQVTCESPFEAAQLDDVSAESTSTLLSSKNSQWPFFFLFKNQFTHTEAFLAPGLLDLLQASPSLSCSRSRTAGSEHRPRRPPAELAPGFPTGFGTDTHAESTLPAHG
ncbi:hypothetical protein PG997_010707 [Apiospora hydei]|uniref:Uncharacterized protein n=1 Tax=Apiospora hydei TaxID=1337664 RepID=A0ABR1VKN5_9PEZI